MMNLSNRHQQIIDKIQKSYFDKIKTGYTDPSEVESIRELIDQKLLNGNSFYFSSDGSWVYQNCFNIPFTHEGLKKVSEIGLFKFL